MRLKDLAHKRVAIIGFGKEGQAVLSAIQTQQIPAEVTICDRHIANTHDLKVNTQTGEEYLDNLDTFDVLIVSPGVPPLPELDGVPEKTTTSMQFVLEEAAAIGCTTIGVTGSKGKSTVSSLLYHVCTKANLPTQLVGNIGIPGISSLKKLTKDTVLICELSSYQLHRMTSSPQIAVITSFFPDHLPYHANAAQVRSITNKELRQAAALAEYLEAKCHLTMFQGVSDYVFYDSFTTNAGAIANRSQGTKIATTSENALVTLEETQLIGQHNLRNIGLVTTVCTHLGINEHTINQAITTFVGLPHRLQKIKSNDAHTWIDDAISTTPESTMAALEALHNNVDIIILGGQDRSSNFAALAKAINISAIHTVVLFPESGQQMKQAIEAHNPNTAINFYQADSMQAAVEHCKKVANNKQTPQTILLSTAAASYGLFTNFEEKGKQFAQYINQA